MEKEANWVYSRCVLAVLLELAQAPGTPMQIRVRTGMTQNNYVNIILKRLEAISLVKCLTPNKKVGRVFCIAPENKGIVENIFREKGIKQRIDPLPCLNWKAYGMLLCKKLYTQIILVFEKTYELLSETDSEDGRKTVTVPFLQREKLPKMATSDIHRALNSLVELGLMLRGNTWPREYALTDEAKRIIQFDPSVIS